MKKLFLVLLMMSIFAGLNAQVSAYGKNIHRDYGTFKICDGENIVSVGAFVTIEKEIDVLAKKGLLTDENIRLFEEGEMNIYHYEIYFVSKSIYLGDTTNTWLYGTEIYVNNENVLKKQFPNGFVVSVRTEPTLIHTHHANNTNVEFEISWEKSVYEPRIRK